jgi:LysR family transcriptional regulator, glycine cleavage system transcriptional activator
MRTLSRLKAIQAFEATVRHGSYIGAAAELKVTPAAIGQQVRLLEDWLGIELFIRLGSGAERLEPTPLAKSACVDFSSGLDSLAKGISTLSAPLETKPLVITASQAFAAKWLLPRLGSFTSNNPSIEIRLDVSDRLLDLNKGEADIAIRCGAGNWPQHVSRLLIHEEVFPAASPAFLKHHGRVSKPEQLLSLPLIHDVSSYREDVFPSWSAWLSRSNITVPKSIKGARINSAMGAIQAATNSQGVALVRSVLAEQELTEGRLIRVLPKIRWPAQWAYYLVLPHQSARPQLKAFADWMIEESRKYAS